MYKKTGLRSMGAAVVLGALEVEGAAGAQDKPTEAKPPAAGVDGITFGGYIEAGSTWNLNGRSPNNKYFGRLFDDRNRQFQLNQLALLVQRKIDPTIEGYDFGFKFNGIYGSDARYTHFLHEFKNATGESYNQFDIVEANVQADTPWFTDGGFDIKAGQYVTLEGAETIDPTTNFLYSHSYISNFGIPFKHTGVIPTLHATSMLDIYRGIDTGVNRAIGDDRDNNGSPAFHGGFGLNLLEGNLTRLWTTHIGPENPSLASNGVILPRGANKKNRYLNDITTIWKVTDAFQLINDLNYIQDDCQALNGVTTTCRTARGYGMAQYAVYTVNDMITIAARGEVWRDEEGIFVSQFANNNDFVRAENGLAAKGTVQSGGRTTYGSLTGGVNIKPAVEIPYLASLVVRPEVRYDTSLNDTRPFSNGTKHDQVTIAADVILSF